MSDFFHCPKCFAKLENTGMACPNGCDYTSGTAKPMRPVQCPECIRLRSELEQAEAKLETVGRNLDAVMGRNDELEAKLAEYRPVVRAAGWHYEDSAGTCCCSICDAVKKMQALKGEEVQGE